MAETEVTECKIRVLLIQWIYLYCRLNKGIFLKNVKWQIYVKCFVISVTNNLNQTLAILVLEESENFSYILLAKIIVSVESLKRLDSLFILVLTNLTHKICFTISLFHASTCFEHHVLIVRRSKLYYTESGIITPIGGRPVNTCARDGHLQVWWYQRLYNTILTSWWWAHGARNM